MASVNEQIVREFFESLGFLVNQPRKYQVMARAKQAEEEVDFVVFNPQSVPAELPPLEVWSATELRQISRAVVGVRGWHSERFSPAKLAVEKELFRLADNVVMQKAHRQLGAGPVAKILCLPDLPVAGPLRHKSLDMLKEGGIDGVLLFRPMLLELIRSVDAQKNYERSDLLQVLRILKAHDLLKDAQLDLFRVRKKRKEFNRQNAKDAKSE
ncbi:MAG: hypothetical protein EPN23_10405 [Verrucomicrobia bacterium]|nr:MAG: hypothetical protein EPN23_10405 [Verrucomicrobiota bacterium]